VKAHFLGSADGSNVFEDCKTGEIVSARPLESGKPILPGQHLATVTKDADGAHYAIDVVPLGHSGPAQVATESYRSGWEATFGKQRGPAN
jgi:hypothetical protein